MPGLSDYRGKLPNEFGSEEGDILWPESPSYMMGYTEVPKDVQASMLKRYQDSLGFADLSRTGPDSIMHRMLENIPKSEWDMPRLIGIPTEEEGMLPAMYGPVTIRELMEALGKLAPKEQQAP